MNKPKGLNEDTMDKRTYDIVDLIEAFCLGGLIVGSIVFYCLAF